MKTLLIPICLLFSICGLNAQYFIELTKNYELAFGYLDEDRKETLYTTPIEDFKAADHPFVVELKEVLDEAGPERAAVLFYLHAMWGSQKSFVHNSVGRLQEELLEGETPQLGTLVTILWHSSHISYKKNWKEAYPTGERMGRLIRELIDQLQEGLPERAAIHFLCHSMGNRIFEGMAQALMVDEPSSPYLDELVMAAPDLHADVFEEGRSFAEINRLARRVHVYYHNDDRILKLSELAHNEDRLGLAGPGTVEVLPPEIVIVNVNYIRRDRASRHLYFKDSFAVLDDIRNILSGMATEDIPNRFKRDNGVYSLQGELN